MACVVRSDDHTLNRHIQVVRENATFLDRDGTRGWYARTEAPVALYLIWALQKLLRRLATSKGPILDTSLTELMDKAWYDTPSGLAPKHPLQLECYKYYSEFRQEDTFSVDARTVAAWKSGDDRPSYDALGRHFSRVPDMLGLVLNFAFAGLVEAMTRTLHVWVATELWADCRRLLREQARCLQSLDDIIAEAISHTHALSLPDFERLLVESLDKYTELLRLLPKTGADSLDLRVAKFRVYEEYQSRIAGASVPPGFADFCGRLETLWRGTALKAQHPDVRNCELELTNLRKIYPDFSKWLAGPLRAIEARLALYQERPTQSSLQLAFQHYQEAFDMSRYQAGTYTARIAREALGLAALLHRRETGEGTIKPWIKKAFGWWDLIGLGQEFDHERLEQRIELAESRFTDELNAELRSRLKAALPQLGLDHWQINTFYGHSDRAVIKELQAKPVDRRQKRPMSRTIVGRDQTALMEAIDRGQFDFARELVRKGADLNFINSTGDTCVTKAFARKDYGLVLEILRRDHEPIRRETLLRVTNKMRISALEQTFSHGQVEILREISRWKQGRGDIIDMDTERIWGQTPLYYAVNCLVHFRASPREAALQVLQHLPDSVGDRLKPEILEELHTHLAKGHNPSGVLECIEYLIGGLKVNLDAPNINDNTALTLAVEARMGDVTAMLLAGGANVNHRFVGGGTSLVRAILNNDVQAAKLLLEYGADDRLFVDALRRPLYLMEMSSEMRRLIPEMG